MPEKDEGAAEKERQRLASHLNSTIMSNSNLAEQDFASEEAKKSAQKEVERAQKALDDFDTES